ncbi:hypothetical protein BKH41_01205 [Helicobacter sp. 12S02232-10]|uniref:hypothetical protein n=1 Tax=Helicobacter sp. 12S02232-10 TaxID=1476197 RepID=UPI000BA6ADFD|nr:hypothetical protein [Helicobacter sp. 12S02232-10]PAF49947.1 hypothetical protein BKH41_01205 [Helicobacter sp. 12S02232-10]
MKKLLKYDFLDNYTGIFLLNALVFFSIIGVSIFSKLDLYYNLYLKTFVIIFYCVLFMSLLLWIVLIILAILNSINKKLFSSQGYLTFCLPLSIDMILISKILINLFWIVISLSLFYVALFIGAVINPHMQDIIVNIYRFFLSNPLNAFLIHLDIFASIALSLIMFLFVLSLLNIGKIKKYRFIVGVFIYLGLQVLIGVITSIIWGLLPNFYTNYLNQLSLYNFLQISTNQTPNIILYILNISINAIQIIILYFIIRYLIKNKLELE